MDLIIGCVRPKYATFSGRARRKEYWLFYLAWFILAVIAFGIDEVIGSPVIEIGVVGIVNVALICPSLAVSVRRLHDTNRKAWWLLMYLIPVIGVIWLIVLFCFKGTEGENRFGPDPLAPEKDDVPANIETSSGETDNDAAGL
jgi:uncharacterized membrane protein YhaH (DUF805 family)